MLWKSGAGDHDPPGPNVMLIAWSLFSELSETTGGASNVGR